MIRKSIIGLIVMVAIVGLAFATINLNNTSSGISSNVSNYTKIPGKQVDVLVKTTSKNSTSNTKTLTGNTPTMISPSEAQKIANTYINSSGAAAGTPELINQSGKLVYIVPVIDNGANVGEIDIDAQNGQNLGGAGGAP